MASGEDIDAGPRKFKMSRYYEQWEELELDVQPPAIPAALMRKSMGTLKLPETRSSAESLRT
jgi:hypothetical protein